MRGVSQRFLSLFRKGKDGVRQGSGVRVSRVASTLFPLKGSFLSAALGCSDAPKKNTDPEQQRAANDYLDNGVDELATHELVADEGDGNEFASNDM